MSASQTRGKSGENGDLSASSDAAIHNAAHGRSWVFFLIACRRKPLITMSDWKNGQSLRNKLLSVVYLLLRGTIHSKYRIPIINEVLADDTDLFVEAATGHGKTLAFLIPVAVNVSEWPLFLLFCVVLHTSPRNITPVSCSLFILWTLSPECPESKLNKEMARSSFLFISRCDQ